MTARRYDEYASWARQRAISRLSAQFPTELPYVIDMALYTAEGMLDAFEAIGDGLIANGVAPGFARDLFPRVDDEPYWQEAERIATKIVIEMRAPTMPWPADALPVNHRLAHDFFPDRIGRWE